MINSITTVKTKQTCNYLKGPNYSRVRRAYCLLSSDAKKALLGVQILFHIYFLVCSYFGDKTINYFLIDQKNLYFCNDIYEYQC